MIKVYKKPDTRYAIILIGNTENDKVYIDVTKNVDKYFTSIKVKLEEGASLPSLLKKDIKEFGVDAFEIEVLEYLDKYSHEHLMLKRNEYIDKYGSLDKDSGYNIKSDYVVIDKHEDDDPWTMNDTESLNSIIQKAKKNIDTEIEYSDDRMRVVEELFDNDLVVRYLSSDYHRNKQVKNKSNFLCETERMSNDLQILAYYLLVPKFKNEEHKMEFILDDTGEVLNNHFENNVAEYSYIDGKSLKKCEYSVLSKSRYTKDSKRELLLYDDIRKNGHVDNFEVAMQQAQSTKKQAAYTRKDKKSKKKFIVETSQKVTKDDLKLYTPLLNMDKATKNIQKLTGIGSTNNPDLSTLKEIYDTLCLGKSKNHPLVKKGFDGYVNKLNTIYRQVKGEIPYMRERLARPIAFKSIGKSSGTFDYDYDKMNFTDVDCVKELFISMAELKERHYAKLGDMWANLVILDQLIDNTGLTKLEEAIVELIKGNHSRQEILEYFQTFDTNKSDDTIRRTIDEYIPKKLVDTYKQWKEDWLYTEVIRGKYKTCTKCKEVKLLNKRNFYKRPDYKGDGFYNQCKNCKK